MLTFVFQRFCLHSFLCQFVADGPKNLLNLWSLSVKVKKSFRTCGCEVRMEVSYWSSAASGLLQGYVETRYTLNLFWRDSIPECQHGVVVSRNWIQHLDILFSSLESKPVTARARSTLVHLGSVWAALSPVAAGGRAGEEVVVQTALTKVTLMSCYRLC